MYDFTRMVSGDCLPLALRREALACYVHRYTAEHVPLWARRPRADGTAYPVQFASDADWLAHTLFPVTKDRKRLRDAPCYSTPTWPRNPELHKRAAA